MSTIKLDRSYSPGLTIYYNSTSPRSNNVVLGEDRSYKAPNDFPGLIFLSSTRAALCQIYDSIFRKLHRRSHCPSSILTATTRGSSNEPSQVQCQYRICLPSKLQDTAKYIVRTLALLINHSHFPCQQMHSRNTASIAPCLSKPS